MLVIRERSFQPSSDKGRNQGMLACRERDRETVAEFQTCCPHYKFLLLTFYPPTASVPSMPEKCLFAEWTDERTDATGIFLVRVSCQIFFSGSRCLPFVLCRLSYVATTDFARIRIQSILIGQPHRVDTYDNFKHIYEPILRLSSLPPSLPPLFLSAQRCFLHTCTIARSIRA